MIHQLNHPILFTIVSSNWRSLSMFYTIQTPYLNVLPNRIRMQKQKCEWYHPLCIRFLIYTTTQKYVFPYNGYKQSRISSSIIYPNINTKSFTSPVNIGKRIIGYAQQDISLNDYQTTKYRINELTDFMDAYTLKYLTQGTSETLKKLYCSNFSKQQERENKAHQKNSSYL